MSTDSGPNDETSPEAAAARHERIRTHVRSVLRKITGAKAGTSAA
ncbi:hypothetical protein [Methylobacterium nigriterrae]